MWGDGLCGRASWIWGERDETEEGELMDGGSVLFGAVLGLWFAGGVFLVGLWWQRRYG